MNMAREVANQLLSMDDAEVLGDLVKIYEKKKSELLCLDHSFCIEMAFVTKEAGDALDRRLREQILAVLPRTARLVTLQQARLELESMRAQKQLRFCSGYARDHLSTAIDWVHKMQRNISPKIDAAATKDQFLRAVHVKLANFVTATVQGDAGTEPKTLCVAGPMKYHFANMTDKTANAELSSTVEVKDMEVFQRFKFMLDEAQCKLLADWVCDVLKKKVPGAGLGKSSVVILDDLERANVLEATAASASSSSSGLVHHGAAKGKKPKSLDTTAANIMHFFKGKAANAN
jgi:hypothetical protein